MEKEIVRERDTERERERERDGEDFSGVLDEPFWYARWERRRERERKQRKREIKGWKRGTEEK